MPDLPRKMAVLALEATGAEDESHSNVPILAAFLTLGCPTCALRFPPLDHFNRRCNINYTL
jgi:hypothetical protein